MFSVVPAIIAGVALYGRYTKTLTKSYQDALGDAADCGTESISNARIVKSFGAELFEFNHYSEKIEQSYKFGVKKSMAYGWFAGVLQFVANLAVLVVIYYGAVLVIRGEMTVGSLTTFVFYTVYIALGLGILSGLYTDFMNALGASERYDVYMRLYHIISK